MISSPQLVIGYTTTVPAYIHTTILWQYMKYSIHELAKKKSIIEDKKLEDKKIENAERKRDT